MLILTETNVEEGAALAEKLRVLIERQHFAVEGNAEPDGDDLDRHRRRDRPASPRWMTSIRDADAAMYSAKSLGRNQTYIFAEPDEDARVPRAPISDAGRARAIEVGRQAREPRRSPSPPSSPPCPTTAASRPR